jgi:large subunit ribosomal protein L25
MATTSTLSAEVRTDLGTSNSQRLRRNGYIPVSMYGLGQNPVKLSLSANDAMPVLLAGAHVVDIDLDGNVEMTMIREVQWDTFLTSVLHVDLQRIDPTARIEVNIAINTRGQVNEGVLDVHLHSLTVECPPFDVPANFSVRVGSLRIDDTVTVSDLELPEGVSTDVPGDTIVLRINVVQEIELDIAQEDMSAGAQPEVIGAKTEEDEE